MTRYFTHYWTNRTWNENRTSEYQSVNHTAGNMFRKRGMGPGDYIYIITVVKGKLMLGGRMEIEQLLNRDEAEAVLGPGCWPAADHAIAKANSDSKMDFDRVVPDNMVRQLRFIAGSTEVAPFFRSLDRLDTQTMRGIRELSQESCLLFDRLIDGVGNNHLANRKSHADSPKPDGLILDNDDIRVEPPMPDPVLGDGRNSIRSYLGKVVDHAELDAANRVLGAAGEEFVVAYERRLLSCRGRGDLAARVRRVSQTDGDGVGYDVLSYDDQGHEIYIEVKTTNQGKKTPFYLSLNEIEFSGTNPANYYLYRIFDFASSPKLFVLTGSLRLMCDLEPIQFRASYSGVGQRGR